jgi:hypothetical protein
MYSKSAVTFGVAFAVLFAAATLVMAAAQVSDQLPTAKIVEVEGATTTFQSRDWDGRLVEVEVPSREYSDIRTGGTTQANRSGMGGQYARTVSATIVAINQPSKSVTVQTQQNQMLVLQMPAGNLADMQIGERLTLVVPR